MKKTSVKNKLIVKNKNEVLQLTLDEIVSHILGNEKYIDIFECFTTELQVKNDKLIIKIDNDNNHIKMSLDIMDICKSYGYTVWSYIESVQWEYGDCGCIKTDPNDKVPMLQFCNTCETNMNSK